MKEKKSQLKRVLIMAGGTGGHVFPGLAVANYLRDHDIEVHWLGTPQGLETHLVPQANFPLHLITINGLRGKGIKPLFAAPIKVSTAIMQARRILNEIRPDIVIGMGGFVSGPGGVASWLNRCPLIIHEQNAKAGFTNKMLGPIAKKILEGFPMAFKSHAKVIDTGNPIRPEIENLPPPKDRFKSDGAFHLLVLGGSLGAKSLNDMVPRALAQLNKEERPQIFHQTGPKHLEDTKKNYESLQIDANLTPFIDDMGEAYAWADMVLCRAGALTVSELCSVGLGAILIPFPYAVDDHQTANANYMVEHDAAIIIQQRELTESRLADIVRVYSRSPEKRFAMAVAAYRLRKTKVIERIFEICKEVCR